MQTLAEVAASQQEVGLNQTATVEISQDGNPHAVATLAEATLNQDGQIILTGDAGNLGTYPHCFLIVRMYVHQSGAYRLI